MLRLFYDHPSPAAAVAVLRLQRLADEGLDVTFVGFDVLGLQVAVPATLDQLAELERNQERARELGLEMRRPRLRPPTLGAHVINDVAEDHGLGAAWRWACLSGYWTRGVDLGDHVRLRELAASTGLPRGEVAGALADAARRAAVRARMLEARSRGIGGVPVLEHAGTLLPPDLNDDDLRALAAM